MSRKIYVCVLVLCLFALCAFSGYRYGIHHAMTESVVSVYLDGRVEIQLDGDVYEHIAF